MKEKEHFNWKGDKVKYFGLHLWIRELLNTDKCEFCGISGYKYKNGQWSIECANKSGEYKRDINDWYTLCRKCHNKYDNDKRKPQKRSCSICKIDIWGIGNRKDKCENCKKECKRLRNRNIQRKKRNSIKYNNSKYQDKNGISKNIK